MLKWVKFLRNYTVQAENGATYSEGDIVQMSHDGAKHFISRQAAIEVDAPEEPKAKPVKEVPAFEPVIEEPVVEEPVVEKPKPKRRGRKRKN
jgi:hypothetical protein